MSYSNKEPEQAINQGRAAETAPQRWKWVVVALAAVVIRTPDFFMPINRDAGLFAYGGWRILHGALPYVGFWDNKLPGVFYINALAIRLFGPTTWGLVVFQMIWGAATACAFSALARKLCRRNTAFIISLLFVFYQGGYGLAEGGNYTEVYVALPMLVAVLLLLRWSRGQKGYLVPAISGAAAAIAVIIKQPAGSVIAAMVLFLILGNRERRNYAAAGAVITGAAAMGLAMVGWMAHKGILHEAYQANIVFNRLYFSDSYHYGLDSTRWAMMQDLDLMALPLVGAIAGIISLRRHLTPSAGAAWLLVPWFAFDLAGVAMGGRFYNHYFLAAIVSTILLTGVAIDGIARGARSAIAVSALGLLLFFGPVWSYTSDNPRRAGLPVSSIAEEEYRAVHWIFARRLPLGAELPAETIAKWIKERTTESDMIYVWGWNTRIAFLAQRAMPSRYLHTHPLGATGFDRDRRIRELANDLERRRPKYIVDDSPELPTTTPPLGSSEHLPQFSPFFRLDGYEPVRDVIKRHYKLAATIRGCPIYEAK